MLQTEKHNYRAYPWDLRASGNASEVRVFNANRELLRIEPPTYYDPDEIPRKRLRRPKL